jgi:hypothetical protein
MELRFQKLKKNNNSAKRGMNMSTENVYSLSTWFFCDLVLWVVLNDSNKNELYLKKKFL